MSFGVTSYGKEEDSREIPDQAIHEAIIQATASNQNIHNIRPIELPYPGASSPLAIQRAEVSARFEELRKLRSSLLSTYRGKFPSHIEQVDRVLRSHPYFARTLEEQGLERFEHNLIYPKHFGFWIGGDARFPTSIEIAIQRIKAEELPLDSETNAYLETLHSLFSSLDQYEQSVLKIMKSRVRNPLLPHESVRPTRKPSVRAA